MLQAEQILQNRYRLKQSLGNNAGRHTWLAQDLEKDELVVVKVLEFGGSVQWDDLKLFEREAQVLGQLNHPHIPKYRDYFSVDDRSLWFGLVQEYISGLSLKEALKQGKKFTEAEVKKIALDILEILTYLHELNPPVLHRDIKPSNLIWKDGQVYLVDFGAVQDKAAAEGRTFTVVGTYGYAPMEQFGGRAIPASDLYALGSTLIHLLTGISPAELPQKDLRIQFSDRTSADPNFVRWIEWLAEPSPDRRCSSARQAIAALKDGLETGKFLSKSRSTRKFERPPDSNVQISDTNDHLSIEFPAHGFASQSQKFTRIILLGTVGIPAILTVLPLIAGVGIFAAIIGGGGFFAWVRTMIRTIRGGSDRRRVNFSKQTDECSIELLRFGKAYQIKIFSIDEIEDVFQSIQVDRSEQEQEIVSIQTKSTRYTFGLGLSAIECAWIAHEIKVWLDRD